MRGSNVFIGRGRRSHYDHQMTIAGNFITALQQEQRIGNVSSETEQHLKHEFRKLGRDASGPTLVAAVDAEINRLARQATTLQRLREGFWAWRGRWKRAVPSCSRGLTGTKMLADSCRRKQHSADTLAIMMVQRCLFNIVLASLRFFDPNSVTGGRVMR